MAAIRVLEYLDSSGRSPWRRWFNDLDAIAAAKAGTASPIAGMRMVRSGDVQDDDLPT